MRNKKTIMIGILCTLVAIMAVGYAALASQLNINGRASIDSTWKVGITNIKERDIIGDASSKVTPSYTATTANFSVSLIQPGDSITYDIEMSNEGSLAAKVDSINITESTNDAIVYTVSGIKEGDKLGVNEKDTISLTVAYNSEVTSQPENTNEDITVTINYVQDLGTSNEPSTAYDYVIGDQISFAGSNWYVIKNSSSEEDYVTLLKEQVLINSELGNYAENYTCTFGMNDSYGHSDCTVEGQLVYQDGMPYYWSDTCHGARVYGYSNYDWSGCSGHNDYEGSKVREFLEGTYINTLGSDNLKEVDGYKIRLITWDELLGDLGYTMDITSGGAGEFPEANDNVPTWVYQNFGGGSFWTMTPDSENSSQVWKVISNPGIIAKGAMVSDVFASGDLHGVRPVINLLKSSI